MDSNTYSEMYKFEWEQRSNLNSAVNIPIVAITAVGGAAATIGLGYPYGEVSCPSVFVGFLMATTACLTGSVYSIFRSLISSKYSKTPSPIILRQHLEELTKWHLANGSTVEAAREEFSDMLDLRRAEATDQNARNNEMRGIYLFRATILVAAAVSFLSVSSVLYVKAKQSQPETVYSVKITGDTPPWGNIGMTNNEKKPGAGAGTESTNSTQSPPVSSPQTPVINIPEGQRPQFPQNVDVHQYIIEKKP